VFALIPACATKDAGSWEATDTVDTASLASAIDRLIKDGVHGIIILGSSGEVHTLLWEEQKKLIRTAVETVARRVPLFVGVTSLHTRESIAKAKFVEQVGGIGILSGVPMYIPSSVENAVQYYKHLAEACPNLALMIYHEPSNFRVTLPTSAWKQLAEIPNIVAAKETLLQMNHIKSVVRAVQDQIAILVHEEVLLPSTMFGASGCWTQRATIAGPWALLALYDACKKRDWELALKIQQDVDEGSPPFPFGFEKAIMYQVNLMKVAWNEGGYCQAGPARPPFIHTPGEIEEYAKLLAKKQRELADKYRPQSAR